MVQGIPNEVKHPLGRDQHGPVDTARRYGRAERHSAMTKVSIQSAPRLKLTDNTAITIGGAVVIRMHFAHVIVSFH